jgi:hypothetical protein
MDLNERKQLENDYRRLNENIIEVLFCGRNNGAVLKPDYITPTVDFRRNLPFDSVEGELSYFFSLRVVLERAVSGQPIPEDSVHCGKLPKYVSDLVR